VQLVGEDSLGEEQKAVLDISNLLREDYLQQNGYSPHDYTCPLVKCAGMIRNFVRFFELGTKTVKQKSETPILWSKVRKELAAEWVGLTEMKFVMPNLSEEKN